tara:strand:- start:355 stop:2262 length:1908 start_codon:yes stop_codon:yes gene_type:complete
MNSTDKKKYKFDIERDIVKYGDEGIKYTPKLLASKTSNKINHKISHSHKDIKEHKKESYLVPFKSKEKHHEREHVNNLLDSVIDKQQQGVIGEDSLKDKAKQGLVPVFGNGIMKPTHDDVSAYERELAVLNEASMKHGHDSTRLEVQDYLRNNGVNKYDIDFENSTSDALVFVNKQTGKATLSFRGSSLTKHAKNDWSSNAEIGASKKLDTKAHKKIDTFYNRINAIYDVEHVTGYSRGGHFATFLANKYDINSTAFNPFISVSNIVNAVKGGNAKHTIINITEDLVSVFAPIYELNNPNQVEIKTLLPTSENTGVDPIAGHNNTNFLNERKLPRANGRRIQLQEKVVAHGTKIGELEMVERAKIIKDNGGSITDFIKRINPNDVEETRSLIDGSKTTEFSERIKGGGIETKIWNEVGGEITRAENIKLNQNVSINPVEFETTRLERLDHSNAPQHIRRKNVQFLQEQLKDSVNKLNTQVEGESATARGSDIMKAGFKSVASMGAGAFVGYELEENVNKQLGEFSTGVVSNVFQPKKMLRGGIGTLASGEIADAVSGLIDDKPTANVVNSAINLGSLPVTEAIGEFALGRVATLALGVAAAPFVAPTALAVGGFTAAGVGLGLLANRFFGSGNKE